MPRRGFTLVELLVVIGIIAMLAALVTPAVINARKAARVAAIKTEIDMLHMAMMNYRNEFGSLPPCSAFPVAGSPSAKHLARLFPRCSNVVGQLGSGTVTPQIAMVSWLSGYTSDPTLPITGTSTGGPRRKLYDFDMSRVSSGQYAPSGLPNSPYVYIDSTAYGTVSSPTAYTVGSNTYRGQLQTLTSGAAFFNPDTFQILCAGVNGTFGDDDDLSNFWPGTRKQYLDSLQTQ